MGRLHSNSSPKGGHPEHTEGTLKGACEKLAVPSVPPLPLVEGAESSILRDPAAFEKLESTLDNFQRAFVALRLFSHRALQPPYASSVSPESIEVFHVFHDSYAKAYSLTRRVRLDLVDFASSTYLDLGNRFSLSSLDGKLVLVDRGFKPGDRSLVDSNDDFATFQANTRKTIDQLAKRPHQFTSEFFACSKRFIATLVGVQQTLRSLKETYDEDKRLFGAFLRKEAPISAGLNAHIVFITGRDDVRLKAVEDLQEFLADKVIPILKKFV